MSTQSISIEETIFQNSVKRVISELNTAVRFLSGEAQVSLTGVTKDEVVSSVLRNSEVISFGFVSIFESAFYRRRFSAINQVVSKLVYSGWLSLTIDKIQSVVNALSLYLLPLKTVCIDSSVEIKRVELSDKTTNEYKQVEIFEAAVSAAPEGLSGLSVSGYIFKALTVYRLHALKIYTFDQLFCLSQRDLFILLSVHLKLGVKACHRTIADINDSLDLRGFPNLLLD